MKSQLIGIGLFTATAIGIGLYPVLQGNAGTPAVDPVVAPAGDSLANERPKVEVVFVLDTTGSMGGLIQAAKEKIWSIATTMAAAQPAPEIEIGLVAYRDRGDAYVTQVVDLSADLDSVYATLMDFEADGGGDGPESVNRALYDAVHGISWSQDENAYQVVFLVGDAPPHMDYQDDVKYPATVAAARARGIVVNTIQCGQMPPTTQRWREIARLADGKFFQVGQEGSAIAIATPFDARLAELSKALDETRLAYGSKEQKARAEAKSEATEKIHAASSVASLARRAAFNASASGKRNRVGESDLIDDLESGRADLAEIDKDELPAPMQALPREEQEKLVADVAERRQNLQREIDALAQKRDSYLESEVEASGEAAEASLDHQLYDAIREQAGGKGLHYEAGPAY